MSTITNSGPLHWLIEDPDLSDLFVRLASGVVISDANFAKAEIAGKVFLNELRRERLVLAVRAHAAQKRWLADQQPPPNAAPIQRRRKALESKVRNASAALRSHLQELNAEGASDFERKMIASRFDLLSEMIFDPEPRPISKAIATLDNLIVAASQPRADHSLRRGRGKPRLDWDWLLTVVARVFKDAGGTVSLKPGSRFFKFVSIIRSSLPQDVQGASVTTIFDRARKGAMDPAQQARLDEIRGVKLAGRPPKNS
jgi:hypothetical protein